MPEFIKVSEIVESHNGLEICKADSSGISILQWQCQGVFTPDPDNGVVLLESSFLDKARRFIDKAKAENVSLLLTPEYSFPYEVLEEIIFNADRWPDYGKLWCLCTQGTSKSNFENKLNTWTRISNVIVKKIAFEPPKFTSKKFVNPLIYLFRLDNGDLFVLPQFKTGPMYDPKYQFEADGLSCGQIIYIFDLCGNSLSNNRFMSVICSDILHFNTHEIGISLRDRDLILYQMSSGQRASLALSVLFALHLSAKNAPRFILFDEPVANMDDLHLLNLLDILREFALEGTQIIFTTANTDVAALFRRKFSFFEDQFKHFELTRNVDGETKIEEIIYNPFEEVAISQKEVC